ncbi:NADH-quinone oxidoreductase subunit K [Mobiluncus mulieris]|uniref:NADH-quinone oxidoreductase subunit K n=1 Tax=Mobiluncus mulieris TaxID=2052 RepID=A0ABD4TZE5_9ACTO|nr:NADH-quinone oxidoreductase subunit K [Mobiluncus mulieris]MCU9972485.1 NADH-quinone oxidoreductase subunit K [Mobiluncus mulieris]MCV0009934.1 NADH-quinone oxidoreductase subunit K [Mobiluncus mulieris]MCV0012440.1 NADH-quinone oxidoreductase subunit K [Mobiluncus mulieris]
MRFVTFCGHLVTLNPVSTTNGNFLTWAFTKVAMLLCPLNVREVWNEIATKLGINLPQTLE